MASKFKPALDLIKEFEGLRLTAYLDPIGIPTIGYGYTHGVHLGDHWTKEKAEEKLMEEILKISFQVNNIATKPMTDNQWSAFISFAYNVGIRALLHSSLLAKFNQGQPKSEVAAQFLRWDHAGGHVLPGLTRRRKAEHDLFLKTLV